MGGAAQETTTHFRALPTASILLFIKSVSGELLLQSAAGSALDELPASLSVCEGSVVFLPANASATLSTAALQDSFTCIVYRTHVNMAIFDK